MTSLSHYDTLSELFEDISDELHEAIQLFQTQKENIKCLKRATLNNFTSREVEEQQHSWCRNIKTTKGLSLLSIMSDRSNCCSSNSYSLLEQQQNVNTLNKEKLTRKMRENQSSIFKSIIIQSEEIQKLLKNIRKPNPPSCNFTIYNMKPFVDAEDEKETSSGGTSKNVLGIQKQNEPIRRSCLKDRCRNSGNRNKRVSIDEDSCNSITCDQLQQDEISEEENTKITRSIRKSNEVKTVDSQFSASSETNKIIAKPTSLDKEMAESDEASVKSSISPKSNYHSSISLTNDHGTSTPPIEPNNKAEVDIFDDSDQSSIISLHDDHGASTPPIEPNNEEDVNIFEVSDQSSSEIIEYVHYSPPSSCNCCSCNKEPKPTAEKLLDDTNENSKCSFKKIIKKYLTGCKNGKDSPVTTTKRYSSTLDVVPYPFPESLSNRSMHCMCTDPVQMNQPTMLNSNLETVPDPFPKRFSSQSTQNEYPMQIAATTNTQNDIPICQLDTAIEAEKPTVLNNSDPPPQTAEAANTQNEISKYQLHTEAKSDQPTVLNTNLETVPGPLSKSFSSKSIQYEYPIQTAGTTNIQNGAMNYPLEGTATETVQSTVLNNLEAVPYPYPDSLSSQSIECICTDPIQIRQRTVINSNLEAVPYPFYENCSDQSTQNEKETFDTANLRNGNTMLDEKGYRRHKDGRLPLKNNSIPSPAQDSANKFGPNLKQNHLSSADQGRIHSKKIPTPSYKLNDEQDQLSRLKEARCYIPGWLTFKKKPVPSATREPVDKYARNLNQQKNNTLSSPDHGLTNSMIPRPGHKLIPCPAYESVDQYGRNINQQRKNHLPIRYKKIPRPAYKLNDGYEQSRHLQQKKTTVPCPIFEPKHATARIGDAAESGNLACSYEEHSLQKNQFRPKPNTFQCQKCNLRYTEECNIVDIGHVPHNNVRCLCRNDCTINDLSQYLIYEDSNDLQNSNEGVFPNSECNPVQTNETRCCCKAISHNRTPQLNNMEHNIQYANLPNSCDRHYSCQCEDVFDNSDQYFICRKSTNIQNTYEQNPDNFSCGRMCEYCQDTDSEGSSEEQEDDRYCCLTHSPNIRDFNEQCCCQKNRLQERSRLAYQNHQVPNLQQRVRKTLKNTKHQNDCCQDKKAIEKIVRDVLQKKENATTPLQIAKIDRYINNLGHVVSDTLKTCMEYRISTNRTNAKDAKRDYSKKKQICEFSSDMQKEMITKSIFKQTPLIYTFQENAQERNYYYDQLIPNTTSKSDGSLIELDEPNYYYGHTVTKTIDTAINVGNKRNLMSHQKTFPNNEIPSSSDSSICSNMFCPKNVALFENDLSDTSSHCSDECSCCVPDIVLENEKCSPNSSALDNRTTMNNTLNNCLKIRLQNADSNRPIEVKHFKQRKEVRYCVNNHF